MTRHRMAGVWCVLLVFALSLTVWAEERYRKAAEQGDYTAQRKLGEMYAWGQGVLQD